MSLFQRGRQWDLVHFTECAADPLQGIRSYGVKMVMLADGAGADETYVSCLHFEPGAWILEVPALRDTGIFVVHGRLTLFMSSVVAPPAPKFISKPHIQFRLSPGMGMVITADHRYRIESDGGAIALVVESESLEATECGLSTPERIMMDQGWPGESDAPCRQSLFSAIRSISCRVLCWWPLRWVPYTHLSGWNPVWVAELSVQRFFSARKRRKTQS